MRPRANRACMEPRELLDMLLDAYNEPIQWLQNKPNNVSAVRRGVEDTPSSPCSPDVSFSLAPGPRHFVLAEDPIEVRAPGLWLVL